MFCAAKLPFILSFPSYLLSGNDNFRKERNMKKRKKERQSSAENCRPFLETGTEKDAILFGRAQVKKITLNPKTNRVRRHVV